MATLSPDRWRQIDSLFEQALERDADERTAFLRHKCGDDPDLYREVVGLLDAAESAELVLGDSVTQYAAPLMADFEASLEAGVFSDRETLKVPGPLGPYRLLSELGRGGMGTVYLAERADGEFTRKVAVKVVKRGMDTDEIVSRFRHERQILASLQHPNIARLYGGGVTPDGRPYLALEYVEGTPIDRYCKEKNLSVDDRLLLFASVCDAVQYAHQNLVVHRDLKPSNILVTEDGHPRLLDFGIAKLLTADAELLTRTGIRVMTPEYAAPEQATDAPITTATDVYTLGVVLHELLAGSRPGTNLDRPSASASSDFAKSLRGDLDTIVLKALRAEPDRRYASAEALAADVRCYLEGRPVAARPDTVGYRLQKYVRRHRFGVVAAAGFLILAGVFAVIYTVRITEERNAAMHERDKAAEVASFLENLFDASDPFAPHRLDTVTVSGFLELGARQVEGELAGQPLVQAQMQTVLGRVYNRLGMREEALPFLEHALETRSSLLGSNHPDVAETLIELADVQYSDGYYPPAESLSAEALRINRAAYGDVHESVAESMHLHAMTMHALGDLEAAEAGYRDALAMRRELYESDDPEIATALSTLAWVLNEQDKNEEAEALYRESVEMRRRVYGDSHPAVAVGLNNLAVLLRDEERYDEAEVLLQEALDINRAVLGERHEHVIDNLSILASILRSQERYDEAVPIYEEVIEVRREILGPKHPRISITLDSYASLMKAIGEYDKAEELEQEAIEIARLAFGDEHFAIVITTGRLADIINERGDFDRARGAYQEALDLGLKLFDEDNARVLSLRSRLGRCLINLERYVEAEEHLLTVYQIRVNANGADDEATVRAAENLALLYDAWGKPEEAERFRATVSTLE